MEQLKLCCCFSFVRTLEQPRKLFEKGIVVNIYCQSLIKTEIGLFMYLLFTGGAFLIVCVFSTRSLSARFNPNKERVLYLSASSSIAYKISVHSVLFSSMYFCLYEASLKFHLLFRFLDSVASYIQS